MKYKPTIGLEIHVQLKTKSKMFCGCDNRSYAKASDGKFAEVAPNTLVCPVCMGFPGVLPVANKEAIDWTIKTALALNCQIAKQSKFDRKHYFYPDLPKNYQISQYDSAFSQNGMLIIKNSGGESNKIRIRRIHLEEDAGKLIHPKGADYSLVDFNRAGTPLMEIVTEPDITSPHEAKLFLQELRTIIRYLEVSDADMEKGHLRCDANISLALPEAKLGTPVEIKNMNSFRMVERALEYEIARQTKILESGEKVQQETRGWNDEKGITVSQRSKELAPDYRYFPEPDLPPFVFGHKEIAKLKNDLPELPEERQKRYTQKYKLTQKEADVLTNERELGDYFEELVAQKISPTKAANWVLGELLCYLNKNNLLISENRVLPAQLANLISKIDKGDISGTIAKDIFKEMLKTGKNAGDIIKKQGIKLIDDMGAIKKIVQKVINENPKALSDFQKGKATALQFLIGQVMRETRGQVNPQTIKKILEEKIK